LRRQNRIAAPARLVLAFAAVAAAGGCSKLGILDSVMPHDAGGQRAAAGLKYGPHDRQKLDVYTPVASDEHKSVVVFVYGGSWDSGRRQDYGFVGHAFAARGFVTVIPDYRLVPKVRYPAFVQDAAAAVRWVRDNIARYGGDPDRVAVVGHSAGAYNAVMLAVDPTYVDPESPSHVPIDAIAGLAGPYDFLPLDTGATRRAFGGVANLAATQPVRLVEADGPPLFLATGADDATVEPRNTEALAARARAAGRAVTVEVYEEADHVDVLLALGRWFRDRAPVLDDVTEFLRGRLERPRGDGTAALGKAATVRDR